MSETAVDISQIESDLEFTRAMYENDGSLKAMGISITKLETGHVEGEFIVRPEMCNGHNSIQGGFLFTFADALFAGACNSTRGAVTVASQVQIHFIAPAFAGETLRGVAVERQSWGRNGLSDVTVFRGDEVIAEFRGMSRTVGKRS